MGQGLHPYLLFIVIVVGGSQQVAEDHLGDVHALLFVDIDRYSETVVPHLDGVA